jgi:transcriptional regulator with PAS, ATPase and Fis domain
LNKKYNKAVESVSREVMQKIRAYHWPGNVRELENILERSLLFAQGKEIVALDLVLPNKSDSRDDWKGIKENSIAKIELSFLEAVLKQHQGNIKSVAGHMGITSRAVYIKLKKYQLNLADYR